MVLSVLHLLAEQPPTTFEARAIQHVQRLASAELRGRRTGTADGEVAAALVESAFEKAGLQPAGDAGTYRQAFSFPFYQVVAPARLALVDQSGSQLLHYRDDYYLLTNGGTTTGRAAVTFVGHGLLVTEADDYRNVDVRGRVVVALEGTPEGVAIPAAARSNLAKARTARQRGALGLLLVANNGDAPLSRERIWVFRPSNYLDGFLFARISTSTAARLLGLPVTGAQPTWSVLVSKGPFATSHQVEWQARVELDPQRVGHNVIGRIPGIDPLVRHEVVIVGAHYDGGGVDPDGTVYPGAEDNASGTAALLALSEVLGRDYQPKRPILFAAWGAEEQGAWGSRAFVDSYPSLDDIAATFTFDNVGVGDGRFRVFGARNFPEEYRPIADSLNPQIASAFAPRGAGGSDGFTFQVRGVPSFFLHADAPQPFVHTPSDTPNSMASASFESLARYLSTAVKAVADAPGAYIQPNRLARYLGHYSVVTGWANSIGQDWAALRRRGFDIVLVPVKNQTERESLASALGQAVLVRDSSTMQWTEEGMPLRVLPVHLTNTSGDLNGGQTGSIVIRPTTDGFEGAGQRLLRLGSQASLEGDFLGRVQKLATADDVSLIIDVEDDRIAVNDVTSALLNRGASPDTIQELLGGRLQRAIIAALRGR